MYGDLAGFLLIWGNFIIVAVVGTLILTAIHLWGHRDWFYFRKMVSDIEKMNVMNEKRQNQKDAQMYDVRELLSVIKNGGLNKAELKEVKSRVKEHMRIRKGRRKLSIISAKNFAYQVKMGYLNK